VGSHYEITGPDSRAPFQEDGVQSPGGSADALGLGMYVGLELEPASMSSTKSFVQRIIFEPLPLLHSVCTCFT
jgi:hypothetical protein